MNLIGRIKSDAKFRRKIDATFARPVRDAGRARLADPPQPSSRSGTVYRPGRVGTAFDYVIRLVLRHRNPDADASEVPWVAERALVKRELKLDVRNGEETRDEIRHALRDGYRWRVSEAGLDCMSVNSGLSHPDNPWLRNMEKPGPRAAHCMGNLKVHDRWLAQCLRENMTFEEIVEALFVSLCEHRQRISVYRAAIMDARRLGERFVRTGNFSARIAELLLKVSNLDLLYRPSGANFLPPDVDRVFVEAIPKEEVLDLLTLYRAIPDDLFRGESIWLNPDLSVLNKEIRPEPRGLVAGGVKADADLIVDDLLIDIKTTGDRITPTLPLQDFCQLMSYFALTELAGTHRIRRLGVYYARYGYLLEFPVPRARPGSGVRSAFLEWFRKTMGIDKRRVPRFNLKPALPILP
ncbi:MAG: hypothetical protein F4181_00425 [Proteobacteria bacterium]|nr:hypothetical protein [Pseudomonadota bacterium]